MVETVESETSSITEANDSIANADIIVPNVVFMEQLATQKILPIFFGH